MMKNLITLVESTTHETFVKNIKKSSVGNTF